jgi:hypothetical protein
MRDAARISERLSRFIRWFLTASPTDPLDPPVKPGARTTASGRRQVSPRLRAQHVGRVRISEREAHE